MIVQVNIEGPWKSKFGFYRVMVQPLGHDLPSYWMFNGVWHWRTAPDLNPPKPWRLE